MSYNERRGDIMKNDVMKNINEIIDEASEVINSAKKGNFDEVVAKTKSYAEKATKKSAERLEISRKKIELLDSKTKLAKAYEKYGRLAYAKATGEEADDAAIASAEAEIELQRTRSELLGKEIDDLKAVFNRTKKASEDEAETVAPEVEVVEPIE